MACVGILIAGIVIGAILGSLATIIYAFILAFR